MVSPPLIAEGCPQPSAASALEALTIAVRSLACGGPLPDLAGFDPETAAALRRLVRTASEDPDRIAGGVAFPSSSEGPATGRVLVLAKLERYRALRLRGGDALASPLLAALRRRIEQADGGAQVRRAGQGVVEFVLDLDPQLDTEAVLRGLHAQLEQPFVCDDETFISAVVLGAAAAPDGAEVSEVVSQAEQALAHAEAQGLHLSLFCERQRGDASARLSLMHDLRAAVRADELTLAYQPKLNLRTGRIDSAEALLRWTHPVRGVVSPDQFIELAEDTGDIERITENVLHMAVRDQAAMASAGEPPPTLYVNLSGRLVADAAFCGRAMAICAGAVGRIGMEITETAVISDPDHALHNLRAFADAGIPIAIDDYGSGLSSLAYLKMLPAGELKIDKAFILGLTSSHRDPLIVRSTIDLAHALEMEVTAEGVDDPTALALLQVMGCDRVQGFHISKALPLAAFLPLLAAPLRSDLLKRPGLGLLSIAR